MFVSGRFFLYGPSNLLDPRKCAKDLSMRNISNLVVFLIASFWTIAMYHMWYRYMRLHLIYLAPMSPAWKDLTHKIQGHPKQKSGGFWEQIYIYIVILKFFNIRHQFIIYSRCCVTVLRFITPYWHLEKRLFAAYVMKGFQDPISIKRNHNSAISCMWLHLVCLSCVPHLFVQYMTTSLCAWS